MTGLLAVLTVLPGYPADADARFRAGVERRADAAAARREFSAAAALYDAAWKAGDRTPELAGNRSRAHFLAGDLPAAVLAFRQAVAAYPWDHDLRDGLARCRAAVAYPDPAAPDERTRPDPPAGLRTRLGPADLLGLSALAAAVPAVGLAARFTARPGWATPTAAAGAAGLLAVAVAGWLIDRESAADAGPLAVVTSDGVVLRRGNADSYPPRASAPLPRGAEVRPLHVRGGWVQVELPGGAVGWVPARSLTGGG